MNYFKRWLTRRYRVFAVFERYADLEHTPQGELRHRPNGYWCLKEAGAANLYSQFEMDCLLTMIDESPNYFPEMLKDSELWAFLRFCIANNYNLERGVNAAVAIGHFHGAFGCSKADTVAARQKRERLQFERRDVIVQINGKFVRAFVFEQVEKQRSIDELKNFILRNDMVKTALGSRAVEKVVYIPVRNLHLFNIVTTYL